VHLPKSCIHVPAAAPIRWVSWDITRSAACAAGRTTRISPPIPSVLAELTTRASALRRRCGKKRRSSCGKRSRGCRAADKQARMRELANDDKLGSADRGLIRQELNSIDRGQRSTIRNPFDKDLPCEQCREAAEGYDYNMTTGTRICTIEIFIVCNTSTTTSVELMPSSLCLKEYRP